MVSDPSRKQDAADVARSNAYYAAVFGLLLVGSGLLFVGLDDRRLWADEAETALLGLSILEHGYPTIAGNDAWLYAKTMGWTTAGGVWTWTPWLDEYVAAGSFLMLGKSAWTARLPFAALSLVTAVMLIAAAKLLYGRGSALIVGAWYLCSVPVLYHVRQCRYYSLTLLAEVAVMLGFVLVLADRRRVGVFLLSTGLAVHALTNPLMAVATVLVLIGIAILWRHERRGLLPAVSIAVSIFVATAGGWTWLARPLGQSGNFTLDGFLLRFIYCLLAINAHIFPLGLAAMCAVVVAARRSRGEHREPPSNANWAPARQFLLAAPIAHVLVVALVRYPAFRYLLPLIPLLLLMFAGLLGSTLRRAWLVAPVAIVILLTDRLSIVPSAEGGRSPRLREYVEEIRAHYVGPIDAVATFLEDHAAPGDTVLTADEELSLAFVTGLKFSVARPVEQDCLRSLEDLIQASHENRETAAHPVDPTGPLPGWIVSESVGRAFGGKNVVAIPESWKTRLIAHEVVMPDAPREADDPDPATHQRQTAVGDRNIMIYESRGDGAR